MRVVEISSPGGPEVLRLAERPRPEPGPGEVLIEVVAAGVNRPDILQRKGVYPAPPGASDIPGLEVAGRVVERGDGVGTLAEVIVFKLVLPELLYRLVADVPDDTLAKTLVGIEPQDVWQGRILALKKRIQAIAQHMLHADTPSLRPELFEGFE